MFYTGSIRVLWGFSEGSARFYRCSVGVLMGYFRSSKGVL